jgi:glycerophosphoryl diester phosphodiesterase
LRGRRRAAYGRLPSPLLLGHRGSRTVAPENTIAAVEAAAEAGAAGVEIDVRPCGTGELVVVHDPTLTPLTDGRDHRPVSALSLGELRHIQLGSYPLSSTQRIAELGEVLSRCRQLGLAVNVEMKRDVPSRSAVVQATARALAGLDADQPVVVSSFDPAMLAGLRLLAPALPLALLLHRDGRHYHLELLARPLGAVAIHVERTMVSAPLVRRWRARGLRVVAWTVNHLQEVRDLYAIGVDGFISDDPAYLGPELQRLSAHY